MSITYVVKTGDTLTSIAAKFKLKSWQDIYNFSENEAFRRKRPNPNLIFTGDQVNIPDGGPTPPIPPLPKPEPPAQPKFTSRSILKGVLLPEKQFQGEKGEDISYLANMARITAMPDSAVTQDGFAQVDDRSSLARIDYRFITKSHTFEILQSQRFEFRYTWKVGADAVEVYKEGRLEQTVSQQVGLEIFEHPGHYALRPRQPGKSGFP